jgi:hypothetical protein
METTMYASERLSARFKRDKQLFKLDTMQSELRVMYVLNQEKESKNKTPR